MLLTAANGNAVYVGHRTRPDGPAGAQRGNSLSVGQEEELIVTQNVDEIMAALGWQKVALSGADGEPDPHPR